MGLKSTVYNQEGFQIKSRLWWRAYGIHPLKFVNLTTALYACIKAKRVNFIIHQIGWQVLVNQNRKVSCALSQHHQEKTFVLDNFIPSPSKHVRSWMLVKLLNLIEERQTNDNKLCMSGGVHSLYLYFLQSIWFH